MIVKEQKKIEYLLDFFDRTIEILDNLIAENILTTNNK